MGYGQELTTSAYPSEDELYEALLRNEITYEEFNDIRDLLERGVDSLSQHLWDIIPNLSPFANLPVSRTTLLVNEQATPFRNKSIAQRHIDYKHTYQTQIVDEPVSKYISSLRVDLSRNWSALVTTKREFSGRERLMRRYVAFHNKEGLLREMIVGSFSRRLGLGSVVGYRGKLLNYSDRLGRETILFPDYGGSNGLFLKLVKDNLRIDMLSSVQRDANHSLTTHAVQIMHQTKQTKVYLIGAINKVDRRATSLSFDNSALAVGSSYNYSNGKFWFESSWQFDNRLDPVALIIEGRHNLKNAEILYAGWVYGDSYVDLSGDSKAGNMTRRLDLENVDLRYSNKRTGVEGGMVKTVLEPVSGWQVVTSAVISSLNKDTINGQLLTAIVRKISPQWSIRLDHLNKTRHRADDNVNVDDVNRRTRFETKYSSGNSVIRAYIAYLTASGKDDRLAFFIRWHIKTASLGKIDVWSNMARLNAREGMINYWYVYIDNSQRINSSMSTGVKVSHRYNRRSSDKHLTTVTLELRVTL